MAIVLNKLNVLALRLRDGLLRVNLWGFSIPLLTVVLLFAGGSVVRWFFAHDISVMLDCSSCLLKQSMFHEIQFLLVILALNQLGSWLRGRWLGAVVRCLVLLCLAVMLTDVVVFKFFMARFNWHELLKFAAEPEAIQTFLMMMLSHPVQGFFMALLSVGVLVLCVFYVVGPRWPTRPVAIYEWALPLLLSAFMMPWSEVSFHTPYVENSLMAFTRPQTRLIPYDAEPVFQASAMHGAATCVPGQGKRPPVILLVVESLSTYHSKALGAMNNWTPTFDKLLAQGLVVNEFYANGITTEDGLIALLTGLPPIPRPQSGHMFSQHADAPTTVPKYLRGQGYRSAFLTTGNLEFMDKGDWLLAVGFDETEGHDHPFYEGAPRFHFDAATDELLYARALQWLTQVQQRPFFLTLETVSTHQPYQNPVTGERSLESVVRYADKALGNFVQQLQASGYLNSGYLFITGDHRAMVPVSAQETLAFGDRAYARVPMVVLGPELQNKQVATGFSQTDFLPSLQQLTDQSMVCLGPNLGVFWPDALRSPDCNVTRRAYDQDRLVVQCGKQDHPVKLNANATAYLSEPAGPLEWIDQIHSFRMGRGWLAERRGQDDQ